MKTLGLIGGIDQDSTVEYYRLINSGIQRVRHFGSAARCVIWSFDFSEIDRFRKAGDEDSLAGLMIDAGRRLEAAGADILLICSLTHHDLAEYVRRAVAIPLLHIADPIADRMKVEGIRKVGLLDTVCAGSGDYQGPLSDQHGLEVLVPTPSERASMEWANHLEFAVCSHPTARRDACRTIMARMAADGAAGILFENTAFLPRLWPDDSPVPMFDTIALHAEAAVATALGD